jgi:hypothetical protein
MMRITMATLKMTTMTTLKMTTMTMALKIKKVTVTLTVRILERTSRWDQMIHTIQIAMEMGLAVTLSLSLFPISIPHLTT